MISIVDKDPPAGYKHIVFIAKRALPFFRQSLLSHGKREKNRSIIEIAFSWFDPFINILDSETPLPPHPFSRQVLSTAQPVANRHRTDTDIFGDFFNIDPTLFVFIHKPSQSTAARKNQFWLLPSCTVHPYGRYEPLRRSPYLFQESCCDLFFEWWQFIFHWIILTSNILYSKYFIT